MISIFDIFSIGIGPSSSHTVGPMRAARNFALMLERQQVLPSLTALTIELFGSLAFTGKGHGTDQAVILGLLGEDPETVLPDEIAAQILNSRQTHSLNVLQKRLITFQPESAITFNTKDLLPGHTNGMRFTAFFPQTPAISQIYYSIGGGFIVTEEERVRMPTKEQASVYSFTNAKLLLSICEAKKLTISEVVFANECANRPKEAVKSRLHYLAKIMQQCIEKGCTSPGILPGSLKLKRRAPELFKKLMAKGKPTSHGDADSMEWLNLYAIAVNEENAAGGRVVTAPTNGASGIIPAVLHYYLNFFSQAKDKDIETFLLTAGAIAILYKKGASFSGAEVGCQGEVGVACSMAASALTALLGGSLYQIENAAEIAMEHHLGLTCDPIAGLVQIPCIERNAMGAVKAVNAARLALLGNGEHYVSLDKVIATMKQTGKDMLSIYKETSLGGLAANLPEC